MKQHASVDLTVASDSCSRGSFVYQSEHRGHRQTSLDTKY